MAAFTNMGGPLTRIKFCTVPSLAMVAANSTAPLIRAAFATAGYIGNAPETLYFFIDSAGSLTLGASGVPVVEGLPTMPPITPAGGGGGGGNGLQTLPGASDTIGTGRFRGITAVWEYPASFDST